MGVSNKKSGVGGSSFAGKPFFCASEFLRKCCSFCIPSVIIGILQYLRYCSADASNKSADFLMSPILPNLNCSMDWYGFRLRMWCLRSDKAWLIGTLTFLQAVFIWCRRNFGWSFIIPRSFFPHFKRIGKREVSTSTEVKGNLQGHDKTFRDERCCSGLGKVDLFCFLICICGFTLSVGAALLSVAGELAIWVITNDGNNLEVVVGWSDCLGIALWCVYCFVVFYEDWACRGRVAMKWEPCARISLLLLLMQFRKE